MQRLFRRRLSFAYLSISFANLIRFMHVPLYRQRSPKSGRTLCQTVAIFHDFSMSLTHCYDFFFSTDRCLITRLVLSLNHPVTFVLHAQLGVPYPFGVLCLVLGVWCLVFHTRFFRCIPAWISGIPPKVFYVLPCPVSSFHNAAS